MTSFCSNTTILDLFSAAKSAFQRQNAIAIIAVVNRAAGRS